MAKNTNILIITEGDKDYKWMKRLKELYLPETTHLYCYHCNIYDLYERLQDVLGEDWSDMDLLLSLKDYERRCNRHMQEDVKELLEGIYSDIILIFDFDPQDHRYSIEKIEKLIYCFNNSTENGKLYLSFPMIESLMHMNTICVTEHVADKAFFSSTFSQQELKKHQYKRRVDAEGISLDINRIDVAAMDFIVYHHMYKVISLLAENNGELCEFDRLRSLYRDNLVEAFQLLEIQKFHATQLGDIVSVCWGFVEENYPQALFSNT